MLWIARIIIYLAIGVIISHTTPYASSVPLIDKLLLMIGWLPILLFLFITNRR